MEILRCLSTFGQNVSYFFFPWTNDPGANDTAVDLSFAYANPPGAHFTARFLSKYVGKVNMAVVRVVCNTEFNGHPAITDTLTFKRADTQAVIGYSNIRFLQRQSAIVPGSINRTYLTLDRTGSYFLGNAFFPSLTNLAEEGNKPVAVSVRLFGPGDPAHFPAEAEQEQDPDGVIVNLDIPLQYSTQEKAIAKKATSKKATPEKARDGGVILVPVAIAVTNYTGLQVSFIAENDEYYEVGPLDVAFVIPE